MKKDDLLALNLFVIFWLSSLIILWVIPAKSKFDNDIDTSLLVLFFLGIISITALIWYQLTKKIRFRGDKEKPITKQKILFIIRCSSAFTILGNLFVYIDRVYFRGIDYSKGFRDARYQWEASTVSGSIISKLGNLMIPFSYCALFMCIFHWEILRKRYRILGLIAGFGGQFIIAMLNGGRSNILLSIFFAFVVCVLRKYNQKSLFPKFKGRLFLIILSGIVVLRYVASIFYWTAKNDAHYLGLVADMLGAKIDSSYQSNPIINLLTEIALYILHGIYYTAAVMMNNPVLTDVNHNISFRWIFAVLARTPLLSGYRMELPNFDGGGGNFIALPGILLHDYGYIGFVFSCIILGILMGNTLKFLNTRPNNYGIVELLLSIFTLLHLYMSMITMALGFGYFMFMIFAIFMMEIIARAKYGKSSWMNAQNEGMR